MLQISPRNNRPQDLPGPKRNHSHSGKKLSCMLKSGSIFRMAVFYLVLTSVLTGFFAYAYQMSYSLVSYSLIPGFALGVTLWGFNRLVDRIREQMKAHLGKVLSGFLMFFIYLIGYIIFFSLIVSYPMDWVIERILEAAGESDKYSMCTVNFAIVMALGNRLLRLWEIACQDT